MLVQGCLTPQISWSSCHSLDLGASGINSKKTSELASLSDYAQPLIEFMPSLPQEGKVVLVGHSYGGIIISLAMESYPKQVLAGVYLTAFMPNHDSPPASWSRRGNS